MPSFKKVLHHINSLPFPLTVKHFFSFERTVGILKNDELTSWESWDALREHDPHFSISENRNEWLEASETKIKKDGQDGGLSRRAADVVSVIHRLGISSVFSAGVGGAGLEYQIKKMKPDLKLVCSEYSPVAVERLRKVFLEADGITLFDMKSKDWSLAIKGTDPRAQLCLLYRIDIDLTNSDLKNMFQNMHESGIHNILIILCGRLTARGLVNRLRQRLIWRISGIPYAFAGYLRTEKTFLQFWQPFYTSTELECGGLKSFLLRRVDRV